MLGFAFSSEGFFPTTRATSSSVTVIVASFFPCAISARRRVDHLGEQRTRRHVRAADREVRAPEACHPEREEAGGPVLLAIELDDDVLAREGGLPELRDDRVTARRPWAVSILRETSS